MGAKRIDIEKLSAKWELCMDRPLGHSHAEILLRLRPLTLSVSIADLSVVAEPGSGSGVPSFSRHLLALFLRSLDPWSPRRFHQPSGMGGGHTSSTSIHHHTSHGANLAGKLLPLAIASKLPGSQKRNPVGSLVDLRLAQLFHVFAV